MLLEVLPRLRELLSFDPMTGVFTWLRSHKGLKRSKQLVAGCKRKDGYVLIRIDGALHLAHRLAWLWMHEVWPTNDIDHINGNRSDNRPSNLRDVPRIVNLENQRKARSMNKAGALGVTLADGRYLARIQTRQRSFHLGSFDTVEQAHSKYVLAKRRMHRGCTI